MTELTASNLVIDQWAFLTSNTPIKDLFRLVKFSVPYSHPNYNRRYRNLGMYIEDRIIQELGNIDVEGELEVFHDAMKCVVCYGTCHSVEIHVCTKCQGSGCASCTWSGEIPKYTPCKKYNNKSLEICNNGDGVYEKVV